MRVNDEIRNQQTYVSLFRIGWNYFLEEHFTVEEFEMNRKTEGEPIALDTEQRHEILLANGVKKGELVCAVRNNLKAKHQRRRTFMNNKAGYDRWEEAVESASRKLKKSFQWTTVFSSDSALSRRETILASGKRPAVPPTFGTKKADLKDTSYSSSSIGTSTTTMSKAMSKASHRVLLSINFDKSVAAKEPSAVNAQKPNRPPASPPKSTQKGQDDSHRDSFPKIVLDCALFDTSVSSRSTTSSKKIAARDDDRGKEGHGYLSMFHDSSSLTAYTDSDEENSISYAESSSSSVSVSV
jgi:hypothetical protein